MSTTIENNAIFLRASVRQSLNLELDYALTSEGEVQFSEISIKRSLDVCAYYLGTDSDSLLVFHSPTLITGATLDDVLALGETYSQAEQSRKSEVGAREYDFIRTAATVLSRGMALDSALGVWSRLTGNSVEESGRQIREGISAGYICAVGLDNADYSPLIRFVGTPRLSHLVNYVNRANPADGAHVLTATMATMVAFGTLTVSG